jgi:hypothetical protein
MAEWFFPRNWTPAPRPAARQGVAPAERTAIRDALLAAYPPGSAPVRFEQAVATIKGAVPRLTNDEAVEVANYVQNLWYPGGIPTYYEPAPE